MSSVWAVLADAEGAAGLHSKLQETATGVGR